jgi:hypothetical protein
LVQVFGKLQLESTATKFKDDFELKLDVTKLLDELNETSESVINVVDLEHDGHELIDLEAPEADDRSNTVVVFKSYHMIGS